MPLLPVRRPRGYSLLEVLITVALLGLLLFAVGDAISHVLDWTQLGEGRQNVARSADELATRLSEEARSATAVFVPAHDVLGEDNTAASGVHEVDFYRKTSEGNAAFVAYRLDAPSGIVWRVEYAPVAAGAPQIIHQDEMAEHVSAFAASPLTAQSLDDVVGAGSFKPVNILYGSPELVGGNGIVSVSIAAGLPGEPQQTTQVHLSSRTAPTDMLIYVNGSPTPTPGPSSSPITVAFTLMSPNVTPPHGPNQQGDPGGGGSFGRPGVPGSATLLGNGAGDTASWLDVFSFFSTLTDGVYNFQDSNGNQETLIISCDGSPCPPFVPKPEPTTGPTLLFYTSN